MWGRRRRSAGVRNSDGSGLPGDRAVGVRRSNASEGDYCVEKAQERRRWSGWHGEVWPPASPWRGRFVRREGSRPAGRSSSGGVASERTGHRCEGADGAHAAAAVGARGEGLGCCVRLGLRVGGLRRTVSGIAGGCGARQGAHAFEVFGRARPWRCAWWCASKTIRGGGDSLSSHMRRDNQDENPYCRT